MSFWREYVGPQYRAVLNSVHCLVFAGLGISAAAQVATSPVSQGPQNTVASPFTLNGTVINGVNGSPLPRVLVSINGRAVLTDSQGQFSFPSFQGTAEVARVTKPGYSSSPDDPGTSSFLPLGDLMLPHDFKLYPNAVITGVVTGSDRQPIERTQVTLQRENLDGTAQRVVQVASSQTDAHGRYRFNQPAGQYRISVPYSPRTIEDGEVMLPVDFPQASTSEWPAMFSVASGEEKLVDLHPRTAPSFPVRFKIDGDLIPTNPRVSVETLSGTRFAVFARSTVDKGIYEVLLPSGHYFLRITSQTRDRVTEGSANIVVADHELTGLVIRAAPLPEFPVELAVEAVALNNSSLNSWSAPTLTSLAMRLRRLSQSGENLPAEEVGLTMRPNLPPVFQVSSGSYRLEMQNVGPWYVRSAMYGGAEILSKTLSVEQGGSQQLRMIISNDAGQLSVKAASALVPASTYIYILAHQPSASPVLQMKADKDGSLSCLVPPGNYSVYAFSRRLPFDARNPEIARRLRGGAEVTVLPASKATVDVQSQAPELTK